MKTLLSTTCALQLCDLRLDLGSSAEDYTTEEGWEGLDHSLSQLGGWRWRHCRQKVDWGQYVCPIEVMMTDTWCWWRTPALPLRGYRMVGRVPIKHLPQYEGRRWRWCGVVMHDRERSGKHCGPKLLYVRKSRIWIRVNAGQCLSATKAKVMW